MEKQTRERLAEISKRLKQLDPENAEHHGEYFRLTNEADSLMIDLRLEEANRDNEEAAVFIRGSLEGEDHGRLRMVDRTQQMRSDPGPGENLRLADPKTGRQVEVIGPGQSFRAAAERITPARRPREEGDDGQTVRLHDGLSFGRILRGIATGNWDHARDEQRFMAGGLDASGGFLLSPGMTGEIVDLARNRAAVMRAGARIVPMDDREIVLAKVLGDPVVYWRGEGQAITPSDMTFGAMKLQARTAAAICPITLELLEDAANVGTVVQNAIASAIANAFDLAALRGTGAANEPTGLRYTSGVNEIDNASEDINADLFSEAIQKVAENNADTTDPSAAFIFAPRTAFERDRLKTGDGEYLVGPPSYEAVKKFTTNQVPVDLGTGGNETEIYFGIWKHLLWGIRTAMKIEILPSGTIGDVNAASQMIVWIRAYARGDVYAARPDHFTRVIGVGPHS